MTKFGQVIAYDNMTHAATIEYARPDACDKCGACAGATRKGTITLRADCAVGNWVRLELPDGRFIQATALAYGLPLVGFLMGLFLGVRFLGGDGGAVLGSLLGVSIALIALWLNERRIRGRADWSAQILEVYPEKPSQESIGCGGGGH